MGEETIELGPGTLYIKNPDESYECFGEVTDVETASSKTYDISKYVSSINNLGVSFELVAKVSKDAILALWGIHAAVISLCPNKRVVHLALHGRSKKIRKKNLHRAIKILEGMV